MHYYTTKNNKDIMSRYTDNFVNIEEAEQWYCDFGVKLEIIFNRELYLKTCETLLEYNYPQQINKTLQQFDNA